VQFRKDLFPNDKPKEETFRYVRIRIQNQYCWKGNFESKSERFLGLTLQNDLKWDKHLKNIHTKVNYGLFRLKRLNAYLDKKSLKIISDGLIMSHIRYCISTYGTEHIRLTNLDPKSKQLDKLQKAQNRMLRMIAGCKLKDQVPIRVCWKKTYFLRLKKNITFGVEGMICLKKNITSLLKGTVCLKKNITSLSKGMICHS
jgi:hypothetical protein